MAALQFFKSHVVVLVLKLILSQISITKNTLFAYYPFLNVNRVASWGNSSRHWSLFLVLEFLIVWLVMETQKPSLVLAQNWELNQVSYFVYLQEIMVDLTQLSKLQIFSSGFTPLASYM